MVGAKFSVIMKYSKKNLQMETSLGSLKQLLKMTLKLFWYQYINTFKAWKIIWVNHNTASTYNRNMDNRASGGNLIRIYNLLNKKNKSQVIW